MTQPEIMPRGTTEGGAFGFVRNGYNRTEHHDLSTADIENATIYGREDTSIGTVSALKVGTDGKITDAVIDVVGFLGIGAHSVLIPFEHLTVLRETDGTDLRVHLDTTKDKLKAMPHHAG